MNDIDFDLADRARLLQTEGQRSEVRGQRPETRCCPFNSSLEFAVVTTIGAGLLALGILLGAIAARYF